MCHRCLVVSRRMLLDMLIAIDDHPAPEFSDDKRDTFRCLRRSVEIIDCGHDLDTTTEATLAFHEGLATPTLVMLAKAGHYMGELVDAIGNMSAHSLRARAEEGDPLARHFLVETGQDENINIQVIGIPLSQLAAMQIDKSQLN